MTRPINAAERGAATTAALLAWLESEEDPFDTVPGALYVGRGRGTCGGDWRIYDAWALTWYVDGRVCGAVDLEGVL
jgi:hypothetical protein